MSLGTPGPLPSKHIFLHEISKQPVGTKVRFLGCVTSYDISTGTLVLAHAFPQDAPHVPQVKVDITLILEGSKSDELRTGTWLNIIGYVCRSDPRRGREDGREGTTTGQAERSSIQALVVWNAGAVRIGDYERVFMQQQETRKLLVMQRE